MSTAPAIQSTPEFKPPHIKGQRITARYEGERISQADCTNAVPEPTSGEYAEAKKVRDNLAKVQAENRDKIRSVMGAIARNQHDIMETFDSTRPKPAPLLKANQELHAELALLHLDRDALQEAGRPISHRNFMATRNCPKYKAWRKAQQTVKYEYNQVDAAARQRWPNLGGNNDKYLEMMAWCEQQYAQIRDNAATGKYS